MRYLCIFAIAFSWCVPMAGFGISQIHDASTGALVKQLEEKDVERRRDAVYELVRRVDQSDAVIAALGKATADDDTQVRVQSLTGLGRAGKKSGTVLPELLNCLSNRDAQVRYRAAGALGAIGTTAIEPLTKHWMSASNDSKIAIAQALAIIG
ncbi:MAG TPA: HEAT repeat domain-containing protein, partial [Pirellula sp.]|nr:HEAT repeat domain-containing protein [Pirellula sp.]